MADSSLQSPVSQEFSIKNQGLGLLIHDATSSDPITAAPAVGIDPAGNEVDDSPPSETITAATAVGIDPFENGVDDLPSGEDENGDDELRNETTPCDPITAAPAIGSDPSEDGVDDSPPSETITAAPAVRIDPSENKVDASSPGENEKGDEELRTETTPCNPITAAPVVGSVRSENGVDDSPLSYPVTAAPAIGIDPSENVVDDLSRGEDDSGDDELTNDFERDIYKLCLEQAEIEAARDRLEALGGVEEGDDPETVQKDDLNEEKNENVGWILEVEIENHGFEEVRNVEWEDLDENKNGKDAVYVVEENENEEIVGEQLGEGASKEVRINHSNNRRRVTYPMRPDAEDCAYYMKFGICKFGLNCKFNHPPKRKNQGAREKPKQREESSVRTEHAECKYYLTPGGCKYGKDCKYYHISDKSSISHNPELNFLGLPVRLGERECPYYMRTGSCKYGSNCRFHHPDPTTVAGGDPTGYGNGGSIPSQRVSSPSVSSWSSPRGLNDTSPFIPPIFPPNQSAAAAPSAGWNGYQAPAFQTSERSLPTPPAFAMSNLANEIRFPMQQHQRDMVVEEYPERPGEPECNFFLKTGDCRYRSYCKFHHPKNRFSKPKTNHPNAFSLSDKGLPLRPDQPICAHYHQYGICKYGPACKYDHPSKFGILPPPPFDQPQFSNSKWG